MFRSFFFAGFEGMTGYNRHRQWVDQVAATQHDRQAEADYRRLREAGLLAAREAVRWPLVDHHGRYDFSSVEPFVQASRRHGIEVVWDLFHYGYPRELDPFSATFIRRFADYCHAAARHLAARVEPPVYFTPVNEPSYLAWAAGDAARFAPHQRGRGRELKLALVRAAIAGIDAIRAAAPGARIVNVDPICSVVPPADRPDLAGAAAAFNDTAVFEAWDILAGRLYPEFGGSPDHLDIVGVNYYWTNEWELGRDEQPLAADDPRRVPLSRLLRRVHDRYRRPLVVAETSHVGPQRAGWLRCLANESRLLLDEGVPLGGICLYPILGMPEWHLPDVWVPMGLWDLAAKAGTLKRVPCPEALAALREAQRLEAHPDRPARSGAGAPPRGPGISRAAPPPGAGDPPRSSGRRRGEGASPATTGRAGGSRPGG